MPAYFGLPEFHLQQKMAHKKHPFKRRVDREITARSSEKGTTDRRSGIDPNLVMAAQERDQRTIAAMISKKGSADSRSVADPNVVTAGQETDLRSPGHTFCMDCYTVPHPDGSQVPLKRPLAISVGFVRAPAPSREGLTMIRFMRPRSEAEPKMRVKIYNRRLDDMVCFENPYLVELQFDNETYLTERKEMPFWLVDVLEFAANALRAGYQLYQ